MKPKASNRILKIGRLLALALMALCLAPRGAHALDSAPAGNDTANAWLISGVAATGDLKTIPLGLEVKLAADWHTYWRSPGMAGLPPQIDWQSSLSEASNLKSATLLYPAPRRYTAYGLETIGYRDLVVFPIDAELRTPGKPLKINALLDLLVCSDICVPKHFILKLDLQAGPAKPSADAALIEQFRAQVPKDAAQSGIEIKNIANDGQNLTVDVASRAPLQAPDIFVENDDNISFGAPVVTLSPDARSAQFSLKGDGQLPAGAALTLTIVNGDRALEQKIPAPAATGVAAVPESAPTAEVRQALPPPNLPALPLGMVILFAIIGGFILNLMPCVLPVLSLKVLNVVSHGGGEARVVRHSFLVTAAGILFSYLALACMTIALKEFGLAFGWGVQFQQPIFLGALVLLLTFFAANMFGLFEIRLPRFLADSLTGPYHPKLAGDFAAGAFATLLATPCTAPFLGTAVGFALASGPREILIIFVALGFGMTLPYLAVALWPRLATSLPRPGAWMAHLRHLLGWALAATAAWLIWVLAAQITVRGAFTVAVCMIAIAALFALQRRKPRSFLAFGITSFALLAFGATLAGSLAPKPAPSIGAAWQPFDEAAIAADVAAGKVVFVDVTADWCLTCKANKKFVLGREEIKERLFGPGVVPMQADWTNPDPVIAAFLQKYGRYGIPFNAVFGPGAPQGLVLPELLTPDAVRGGLDKAANKTQP